MEHWTARRNRVRRPAPEPECEAVTIVWSFGSGHDTAFIAGPRYLEAHWVAQLQEAVRPAGAYLAGGGAAPPADALKIQRTAADTGLPWTFIVASPAGQQSQRNSSHNAAISQSVLRRS